MSRFEHRGSARSAAATACAVVALAAGLAMLGAWRATPPPAACTTDTECAHVARALGIAGDYHDAPLGWLARECDSGVSGACEALASARTYRAWSDHLRETLDDGSQCSPACMAQRRQRIADKLETLRAR